MSTIIKDIELYREDTRSYQITVTIPAGDAYTDYKAALTVRSNHNAATVIFEVQKDFAAAAVIIPIAKTDTENITIGSYVYDVKVYKADLSKVKTIQSGKFIILANTTDL